LYYNTNILFCSYLAHDYSMQSIEWNFYVSKSTVSKKIRNTCKILWEKLSPIYLPRSIADDFKKIRTRFPSYRTCRIVSGRLESILLYNFLTILEPVFLIIRKHSALY